MVKLLLAYNANPEVKMEAKLGGLAPLHIAARHDFVTVFLYYYH
jgi:hypothetical protein